MRVAPLAVVACVCACGDPKPKVPDAGGPIDAIAIDADEGTGYRVNIKVTGLRDPMMLTLDDSHATQYVFATQDVTADPLIRFPRRLADGASFSVVRSRAQVCIPDSFANQAIAGAEVTLELVCDGVLDLRSVTATDPMRFTPPFDPRVLPNPNVAPAMLLSSTLTFGFTATPAYGPPTQVAFVMPPGPPTPESTPQVAVSYPGFPTRTYSFTLSRATSVTQEVQFPSKAGGVDDHFGGDQLTNNENVGGHSVAISGDTMVVGAPGTLAGTTQPGGAFIYTRSGTTWTYQTSLVPSPAPPLGARYGFAVGIDGDTVVVGAPGTGTTVGNAYLFHRIGTTWSQVALTPATVTTGSSFGAAVAISGTDLFVGAPLQTSVDGAVYVYSSAGGASTQTLAGAVGDRLGTALSISGLQLAVGAPTGSSPFNGRVVIYTKTGTTWGSAVSVPGTVANARFGSAVALDGDLLVVGAPSQSSGTGEARIFHFNGTTWVQTGIRASGGTLDEFGFAVAVHGTTVLIGMPTQFATRTGAVYIYRCDANGVCSTSADQIVTAPGGQLGNQFGVSMAVDRATLIVGAPFEDIPATDSGAVYVFR